MVVATGRRGRRPRSRGDRPTISKLERYEGGVVTVTGALNVNSICVPGATFFLRKKPPFIRNGAELMA